MAHGTQMSAAIGVGDKLATIDPDVVDTDGYPTGQAGVDSDGQMKKFQPFVLYAAPEENLPPEAYFLGPKAKADAYCFTMATDDPLLVLENSQDDNGSKRVTFSSNEVLVTVTRPNDSIAYAIGDVVSDSTSATTLNEIAGAGRYNAGAGFIIGIRITTSKKQITPQLRIHFYNANNPTVAADNAPMVRLDADESKYLGCVDLPAMTTGADTTNSTESTAENTWVEKFFKCAAGTTSIWFIIETLDAFTPATVQTFKCRFAFARL